MIRALYTAASGMSAQQMEDSLAHITPLGRVADPIDIARVVCFLASDDSFWVNGMSPNRLV